MDNLTSTLFHFFLALLSWLEPPVQCCIDVVRADILALPPVLVGKVFRFSALYMLAVEYYQLYIEAALKQVEEVLFCSDPAQVFYFYFKIMMRC